MQQPGSDPGELGDPADDLARDEVEAAWPRLERDVALHPHRSGNRDTCTLAACRR